MFSDASEKAFSAVGYLRFVLWDGSVKIAFVLAKAKVAPVKYVSMPRMELCGCLSISMSIWMATIFFKELRIKIRRVVLFTDSTTNLRWFNSGSCRFTPYVANRVGVGLESFEATHWHYVPTLQNPADELSRGVPAAKLTAVHRFFHGPAFLLEPPAMWPAFPDLQAPLGSVLDPEVKEPPPTFTGTTRISACSIETLLSSLTPEPVKKDGSASSPLASQILGAETAKRGQARVGTCGRFNVPKQEEIHRQKAPRCS